MKPEDWPRVKQIFQAAIDLPPGERAAYLARQAAGDDELRREVESLLQSAEDSGEFLSGHAVGYVPGAVADEEPPDAHIGRPIGHYRIEREIGSGGMGSVYLAERVDDFTQKVAIKLMRPGMDSRMVVSRFRHERQILAGLDHPNIARLLDGGATEDGRPYFVMEYVQGEPIDVYCLKRALPVRRVLELFRQVCAAVEYAHQGLVVHRDIKPGNILVPEDGVPKLLDFGIAKLLRQDAPRETVVTQAGAGPMTPEYASPEQVRGVPITTATDIYSLGVVLYELLAKKPPYKLEGRSLLEQDRTICETDPERPSTVAPPALARNLRGDLDLIVLKALEKEPSRRYASVGQFSEDLRRHLEGIPVMARPHTLMYRATKFARRNRAAVAAGVLVLVSLAAGLATTTWQANRANRRFNDVRRLARSFVFEFDDKIRDLAGATPARQLYVQRALEYLRSLSQEAGGDLSLKRELAEAYLKVGDVQGNQYVSNLGDTPGALASYREALRLAQDVVGRDPRDPAAALYLARAHRSIGEVLPVLGDAAGAVPHLRKSVEALESIPPQSRDLPARLELAAGYEMLGDVLGHNGIENLGDFKAAREAYESSLAMDEAVARERPDNQRARRGVAVLRLKLGDMQLEAGEIEQAAANYDAAVNDFDRLGAADPDNALLSRNAAMARRKRGFAFEMRGDTRAALAEYGRAETALKALIQADPRNTQATMDHAVLLKNVGDLHYKLEKLPAAAAAYRESSALLKTLAASDPGNYVLRGRYGTMLVYAGDTLGLMGRKEEAVRMLRDGLAIKKEIADRAGATSDDVIAYSMDLIDCTVDELRDPAAALAYARRATAMTPRPVPENLAQLARAAFEAGDAAQAVEVQQKFLSILPAAAPARKRAEERLAQFQAGLKKSAGGK
jgi:eukaryotic-like serine/threonine-protein kinase